MSNNLESLIERVSTSKITPALNINAEPGIGAYATTRKTLNKLFKNTVSTVIVDGHVLNSNLSEAEAILIDVPITLEKINRKAIINLIVRRKFTTFESSEEKELREDAIIVLLNGDEIGDYAVQADFADYHNV